MTVIFSKREDTLFLNGIWNGVDDVKVVVIENHGDEGKIIPALQDEPECLVLCGHGTPSGLIYPDLFGYIVSDIEVEYLRGKTVIGIWCHAAEFADYNNLTGFFTSMFISDIAEATSYGYVASLDEITSANIRFAKLLNMLIRNNVPIYEWESTTAAYRKEIPKDSFEYFNYCGMVNL